MQKEGQSMALLGLKIVFRRDYPHFGIVTSFLGAYTADVGIL